MVVRLFEDGDVEFVESLCWFGWVFRKGDEVMFVESSYCEVFVLVESFYGD